MKTVHIGAQTKELRVLDDGEIRLIHWSDQNPQRKQYAQETFEQMVQSGYVGFTLTNSGETGNRVYRFEPSADVIVLLPEALVREPSGLTTRQGETSSQPQQQQTQQHSYSS